MSAEDYLLRQFPEDRSGQTRRRNHVRNLFLEAVQTLQPGDWPDEVIAEVLRLTDRLHSPRVYGLVQNHEQPDPTPEEIAAAAAAIREANNIRDRLRDDLDDE